MRYPRGLACVFSVFLQTSTPLSCKSCDTTLSELAVILEGEDQIVGFDGRNYEEFGGAAPWLRVSHIAPVRASSSSGGRRGRLHL